MQSLFAKLTTRLHLRNNTRSVRRKQVITRCFSDEQHKTIEHLQYAFRLTNVEKRYLQGHEICEWVRYKWKRFLHVKLVSRDCRMFIEISPIDVPLSNVQQELHTLDEIAHQLTEWNMIEHVENAIDECQVDDVSELIWIPLDVYDVMCNM